MWLTRRFPGTFGIASSAAMVTVSLRGAPCVLPAMGAMRAAAAAATTKIERFISITPVD